jgi:cytochrome b561
MHEDVSTARLSSARYTLVAMLLHWLVALLIVINVALIWSVNTLPDGWVRPAVDAHKSAGVTILGLAVMRVLWRFANPPPPLPVSYRRWERISAHGVHIALLLLLVGLPLSGWTRTQPGRTLRRFRCNGSTCFPGRASASS